MGTKKRRAQEKQIRLNQILDAARKLLFSDGIGNISISKIARQAELGVGTIYFYFKNKEEIFVALQEEGLALFYDIITKINQTPLACDEKLKQIGTAFYQFSQEYKDYYDIINYFLSSSKEFFEPQLKNKIDMSGSKILSLIENVIVRGIEDKTFHKEDAKKYAILFFGALHGMIQLKKLERTALGGANHKRLYEYSINKLVQGLIP
ncbi:MAG: TetR/AcrR family transcriptional regulator [Desulfobacula sp.]|nr:TetR/AcrR family transcriptional regulator [Desulfobacula sp.]